jgi:hypothetical protein
MRKVVVLLALVVAVAAWTAASASATIHPLVCSENSAAPADTPAKTQNPPGITDEGFEGNTDPDPDIAVQAQPVVAISSNSTTSDSAAPQAPGLLGRYGMSPWHTHVTGSCVHADRAR